MKATIIGQDYLITIEKEKEEFVSLKNRRTLEAGLVDGETSGKLNKRITLEVCDRTDNPDGIDLIYLPEKRGGWEGVREIKIRLLSLVLGRVESLGHFGTRYDGSNMIEIYDSSANRRRSSTKKKE